MLRRGHLLVVVAAVLVLALEGDLAAELEGVAADDPVDVVGVLVARLGADDGREQLAPDEGDAREVRPFCEVKVARRELKLKRASLTTVFESVELSVVTNAVSRSVWMPVREKSFWPSAWFCDST